MDSRRQLGTQPSYNDTTMYSPTNQINKHLYVEASWQNDYKLGAVPDTHLVGSRDHLKHAAYYTVHAAPRITAAGHCPGTMPSGGWPAGDERPSCGDKRETSGERRKTIGYLPAGRRAVRRFRRLYVRERRHLDSRLSSPSSPWRGAIQTGCGHGFLALE